MFKIAKSIKTESRLVIARSWGEGRLRSNYLVGFEFPFGVIKILWSTIELVILQYVSVLNTTEMFTLKWLILLYINFTSKKK